MFTACSSPNTPERKMKPSGLLQRLAAGETGQDEIRQDQIEAASL